MLGLLLVVVHSDHVFTLENAGVDFEVTCRLLQLVEILLAGMSWHDSAVFFGKDSIETIRCLLPIVLYEQTQLVAKHSSDSGRLSFSLERLCIAKGTLLELVMFWFD